LHYWYLILVENVNILQRLMMMVNMCVLVVVMDVMVDLTMDAVTAMSFRILIMSISIVLSF